jgi:hypothetical protein
VGAENPLIQSIVVAALRDSGGSNPSTRFNTASIPVIAVQPDEKAFKMRSKDTD